MKNGEHQAEKALWEPGREDGGEIRRKLWALLQLQARDLTMGDSSSLKQEMAEELFSSILYTLQLYLSSRQEDLRALSCQDEKALLRAAQEYLACQIGLTQDLYAQVVRQTCTLGHQALRDTLGNIGIGLERYDFRHFAHECPCEIDYQLCLWVPQTLQGIGYVQEYLRRLMTESLLMNCFDPLECTALLESRFPDFRALLVNLYEPVLTCALGQVLAGKPLKAPNIAHGGAELPPGLTRRDFEQAADGVCGQLGLPESCVGYMRACAREIWPGYAVAREHGNLAGLF